MKIPSRGSLHFNVRAIQLANKNKSRYWSHINGNWEGHSFIWKNKASLHWGSLFSQETETHNSIIKKQTTDDITAFLGFSAWETPMIRVFFDIIRRLKTSQHYTTISTHIFSLTHMWKRKTHSHYKQYIRHPSSVKTRDHEGKFPLVPNTPFKTNSLQSTKRQQLTHYMTSNMPLIREQLSSHKYGPSLITIGLASF